MRFVTNSLFILVPITVKGYKDFKHFFLYAFNQIWLHSQAYLYYTITTYLRTISITH